MATKRKATKKKSYPKPGSASAWAKLSHKRRMEIPASQARGIFMGPNRTYPAKVWSRPKQKFVYSPKQLRAVISRANSQGKSGISARASRALKRIQKK